MKQMLLVLSIVLLFGAFAFAAPSGTNLGEIVQQLAEKVSQLAASVGLLQNQTNQLATNMSTLQTQVGDLQTQANETATNVTFLQMDVSDLQDLTSAQSATLDAHEETLATHTSQLTDLDSRVSTLENAPTVDYAIVHRFLQDDATGNALGWKPNSNLVGFSIVETALQKDSVISVFANTGTTPCLPTKLQDSNGTYTGFLIGCSNPVPDGSTLSYSILNPQ